MLCYIIKAYKAVEKLIPHKKYLIHNPHGPPSKKPHCFQEVKTDLNLNKQSDDQGAYVAFY